MKNVPNRFFRDLRFGLFEGRDSRFLRKRGARFGIVLMRGTWELAILRDSGSLLTKMYKEYQSTNTFILMENRYKCTAN